MSETLQNISESLVEQMRPYQIMYNIMVNRLRREPAPFSRMPISERVELADSDVWTWQLIPDKPDPKDMYTIF